MATATLRRRNKKQTIKVKVTNHVGLSHEPKGKRYVAFITYDSGIETMSPWISKDLRDAKMIARDFIRDDSDDSKVVSVRIMNIAKFEFDNMQVTLKRGRGK